MTTPTLPQVLPAFTPVPRKMDRHNGWKPEVQRAFIEALAETGSVKAAARRVNRSSEGAYYLRRQPEADEFRAAWAAALDFGMQRVEDVAMDRALNGVEVPVYCFGTIVGTRIVYNDRLLMFLLRNRAPERFAGGKAGSMSALDQATVKKLKKQWREEWERERIALDREEEQETLESIDRFIDDIRERREASTSPRARAAYAEAARIKEEDGIEWMDAESAAENDAREQTGPTLPALPSPQAEAPSEEPPAGPRVRTVRDADGW